MKKKKSLQSCVVSSYDIRTSRYVVDIDEATGLRLLLNEVLDKILEFNKITYGNVISCCDNFRNRRHVSFHITLIK